MKHFLNIITRAHNKPFFQKKLQAAIKLLLPFNLHLSTLFLTIFLLLGTIAFSDAAKAQESSEKDFGQLFTRSPRKKFGSRACETRPPYKRNKKWKSFFTHDSTSMSITAGNDCRTLNTGSNNGCVFTVGDNGITQITFDFDISDACHTAAVTDWLAFWIYSQPWEQRAEVDFVESKYGPGSGLNVNFAGVGRQQIIFPGGTSPTWKGSVTVNFSGSGSAVNVRVSNSVNSNVATSTLTRDSGYFFVFNTTATTESGCSITISNVKAKGSVARDGYPNNCNSLLINN